MTEAKYSFKQFEICLKSLQIRSNFMFNICGLIKYSL